ncbi:hypothetical protein SRHO_G00074600 [Serrasalmus rhombeus]
MASKSLYSGRDPVLKKRDDFEDILEERRNSSDLRYALRCYTPALYKGLVPCKASMLKSIVLQSDSLQYVVGQVSAECGESREAVQEEAALLLEEMAHRLQLGTIRFFAFTLSKAFKALFRGVCVNEEGIQRLQQAIQEHPVVLLPSHRSYMDFLMMSYILYTYDLALPVIAAGMDFISMKFVGEMLRMSGAFFIRRSFGGDKLYWAVFSEYVKTMLRGLLKARRILSEDYGSMHVYFGHPVSIRSLAQGHISRSQHNLLPRHIPQKPTADTQVFVNDTAFRLVRLQEENMVLKPWVLLAMLLLQNPDGMDLSTLTELADWLRRLALAFGAFLDWPDHEPCSKVISSSLALHKNLVCVSGGRVRLVIAELSGAESATEEAGFNRAVSVLSCASYRNQILHLFVRPALIAVAMQTANCSRKDEVFNCFNFLRNVFSNEFILCPGAAVQDFEEACYLLGKCGAVQELQQDLVMSQSGQTTLAFLCSVLDPFLQGYQVVCRYLCEELEDSLLENKFVPAVRSFTLQLILSGSLKCYEALSSDLQKNALAALIRLKAVRRVKAGDQVTLKVNKIAVNSLEDTLGGKIPTQKPVLARL